jgi:hypothetical protein
MFGSPAEICANPAGRARRAGEKGPQSDPEGSHSRNTGPQCDPEGRQCDLDARQSRLYSDLATTAPVSSARKTEMV